MGDENIIYTIATVLIPLVIAIVFHEVAHGWVANYFGDPTAKKLGRLTFNPIKHVDPIGTIALPTLLAVTGAPIFGWAKPVPVVDRRMRKPRLHMMIVAFAGPAMNFILALFGVAGIAVMVYGGVDQQSGFVPQFILANLLNFVLINIFLALFNLLPIPPFDGSHIVEGLLPRRIVPYFQMLRPYGFFLLLFLLVVLPMLSPGSGIVERIVVPPVQAVVGFYFGLFGLNG